ncbi:unnamed protein product [Rotaria sordida]|uniref:Protein FAM221A n=1 Tax=Rotaria sordida TaxID=392033 RepID=A0A818M5T6_9BILA|nr:unnamed protein product [Rotaria sordida]CAF3587326.1 unnamed protein product [Rotaria sordida]
MTRRGRGRAPGEYVSLPSNAAADVDAYFEYRAIVGDDDEGKIFTPEEYEEYKKRVLPMRLHNRLYVSWVNPQGMDCILIGPQHKCLCRHKFAEHKTDFAEIPTERPILISCRQSGCRCVSFEYVANASGTSDPNCRCKHSLDNHTTKPPYKCQKNCNCTGFSAPFTCTCGESANKHITLVETREEREKRSHPTGYAAPYQAMGGLTGFSSLAEGYLRLDPSGRGRPDDDFLNQPITAMDHPILRVHASHEPNSSEAQSQLRRSGETELDYYERRYQEKERLSRGIRAVPNPYDADAKLTTGIRNDKSPSHRITDKCSSNSSHKNLNNYEQEKQKNKTIFISLNENRTTKIIKSCLD